MAALADVKGENFDEKVLRAQVPVVVDFWATWCGPCKVLGTKLEEIAAELGSRVSIVKVNIEESPEVAQRCGVRGVPAMLFFKSGEVAASLQGNQSKDTILETLQGLL